MVRKKSKKNKESRWMRTRAWGPSAWFTFHIFAMSYPNKNPKNIEKKMFKQFYILFGKMLPCSLCKSSYAKFIKKCPLTDKVLSSRKRLVYWTFKVHNLVNKKLDCKVLTKTQMDRKYKFYEQFRARGCSKGVKGCIQAKKGIRKPKRTKLVVIEDYSFK